MQGPTRRTPIGYYRAWEPASTPDTRSLLAGDVFRHEAVTEVLQRKAVRRARRSLASRALDLLGRLIEGPLGGVLFLALLGVSLVLWGAGSGW